MIKLYGLFPSRSNRPHWLLEELGVPYTFYQLNPRNGDMSSEVFLTLNPQGKVPVLVDGDLAITESAAICNYLADKYSGKRLAPCHGSRERTIYDQWMFFLMTEYEQPLWLHTRHAQLLPDEARVADILPFAESMWRKAATVVEDALQDREFMIDGRFSVVDIVLTQCTAWALYNGYDMTDFPRTFAHRKRMEERPSFKRMADCPREPLHS